MIIARGTTPEIALSINIDLMTDITVISISQNHTLSINDNRLIKSFENGITTLKFTLTQEETLSFDEGEALLQLKTKKQNRVYASKIKKITFTKILNEDVL